MSVAFPFFLKMAHKYLLLNVFRFRHPSFYKRMSIALNILSVLFLIGLIILIVLYSQSKEKMCISKECLRTAKNLQFSMDLSVDPCEDFYKYTCGKWTKEHPNHGWYNGFTSFNDINEKTAIASLNALTTKKVEKGEPQALRKSRDLYQSCIDVGARYDLGLIPMYQYLRRANLPLVPSYVTKTEEQKKKFTFDWMKSETRIKQILMMDIFIGVIVSMNIYNSSENVIYIGQKYHTCPLPSPLGSKNGDIFNHLTKNTNDDDDELSYEEIMKGIDTNIIKYVMKRFAQTNSIDEPSEDILEQAATIITDMTKAVDEILEKSKNISDSKRLYPLTFKGLEGETAEYLGRPIPNLWINYVTNLFDGTNVTINPEKDLLYVTPEDLLYLKMIIKFVSSRPSIELELYMWWKTVYSMIINTSFDVIEYINKQYSYFGTGSGGVTTKTRSIICAFLVEDFMGFALTYALKDDFIQNTTKPKVERMVNEIKDAFVRHVKDISWMDEATKKVTMEKAEVMRSFVGFPEWLVQPGKLDEYYDDVTIKSNTYLDNMISIIMSINLKKMNALRQLHKRDFSTEPIYANAFNSFANNGIDIPMTILTFPTYDLGLEVMNYGSIGSILGHELTHGFDNNGNKYDKYGNYKQWWTNQTVKTFANLTKCFIAQYDNYTIEGVKGHVNGRKTLGENLADNGGLSQAYSAYESYVKTFGEEPKLPGFENFSNYQMFFIAYSSIWCETVSNEVLANQMKNDVHSPNPVRVRSTMQNSDEFSRHFKCPVGSPMNPKKKCKIW